MCENIMATSEMIASVIRRLPDDMFFVDGNIACHAFAKTGILDIHENDLSLDIQSISCMVPFCKMRFSSVMEMDRHYNCVHRYVCSHCRATFPSPYLLDLHLMETHDSFFQILAGKKPMFQCFLENCKSLFISANERGKHCKIEHKLTQDFRHYKMSTSMTKRRNNKKKKNLQDVINENQQTVHNETACDLGRNIDMNMMQGSSTNPSSEIIIPKHLNTELPNENTMDESEALVALQSNPQDKCDCNASLFCKPTEFPGEKPLSWDILVEHSDFTMIVSSNLTSDSKGEEMIE